MDGGEREYTVRESLSEQEELPQEYRDWFQILHHVKDAAISEFSLAQHNFDGDAKFIFESLGKAIREQPEIITDRERMKHILSVGRYYVEKPTVYDVEKDLTRPLYTYEAHMRDLNYVANVRCEFVYKLIDKTGNRIFTQSVQLDNILQEAMQSIYDQKKSSSSSSTMPENPTAQSSSTEASENIVEYSMDVDRDRTTVHQTTTGDCIEELACISANVGEIFAQINGELCRVRSSGMICHENIEHDGGHHIYNGNDKVTECQFMHRGNYAYVHFQNSSTSQSQSATAEEATSIDSSTASSPVILECDFRPVNDDLERYNSAFHIFMMVSNPMHARRIREREMKKRKFNAESFLEQSSPTEPLTFPNAMVQEMRRIALSFNGQYAKGNVFFDDAGDVNDQRITYGLGEQLTMTFRYISEMTFNMVSIMFLLGFNSRFEMVSSIIAEETEVLLKYNCIDTMSGALIRLPSMAEMQECPFLRQAFLIYSQVYGIIHNQSVLPRVYDDNDNYHSRQKQGRDHFSQSSVPKIDGWSRDKLLDRLALVLHILTKSKTKNKGAAGENVPGDETGTADGAPSSSSPSTSSTSSSGKASTTLSATMLKNIASAIASEGKDETSKSKIEGSRKRLEKIIMQELLQNVGTSQMTVVVASKRIVLCNIIKKMVLVYLGYIPPDFQDNLLMKGVNGIGQFMTEVWRAAWAKGFKKLNSKIVNQVESFAKDRRITWQSIASSSFMKSPFSKAMSKGVWKTGTTSMDASGSTKRHHAANIPSILDSMRKIRTVMNKKGGSRLKDSAAQQLDNSHRDKLCPMRTHNDDQAGVDVYMTLGSRLRVGYTKDLLIDLLKTLSRPPQSSRDCTKSSGHSLVREDFMLHAYFIHADEKSMTESTTRAPIGSTSIFVNGMNFVGYTFNPHRLVRSLKYARCRHVFPFDVGISWVGGPEFEGGPLTSPFWNFIQISGDWGSLLTPYIEVKNLYKLPSIIRSHTSGYGIFPNITMDRLLRKYGSFDLPYPTGDYNLAPGILFSLLLSEGVISYRDREEMVNEYMCESVFDMMEKIEYFMSEEYIVGDYDHKIDSNWDNMSEINRILSFCAGSRLSRGGLTPDKPWKKWSILPISGDLMFSVTASLTPFLNSDDGCRGSYTAGQATQATACPPLNLKWQKNPYTMVLLEPKLSMTPSFAHRHYSLTKASTTVTSITTFLSHRHNGEDAILNTQSNSGKYAVQHVYHRSASAKVKRKRQRSLREIATDTNEHVVGTTALHHSTVPGNEIEEDVGDEDLTDDNYTFEKPNVSSCLTLRSTDYSSIDDDSGLPFIGSSIDPNAAIICKTSKLGSLKGMRRDGTLVAQGRMNVIADTVVRSLSGTDSALTSAYVSTSCVRSKVRGDKFATVHGQKGVSGYVCGREQAPYHADKFMRGFIPDMYRGPHGVPSRTTSGESREMLHSYECILDGRINIVHSTEVNRRLVDQLRKVGSELLCMSVINPETGMPSMTPVQIGILEFRELHHQSREVLNSRLLGSVDPKNWQPPAGTKRGGGAKEGKYEFLNKVAQGASDVAERLTFSGSDPACGHLCANCGLVANSSEPKFLSNIGRIFESDKVKSNPSRHEMEILSSKLFASHMKSSQSGHVSVSSSMTRSGLSKPGSIIPSGGWCPVCRRSDTVYMVRIPRVSLQLLENVNSIAMAWRFVLNTKPLISKNDSIGDVSSHSSQTSKRQSALDENYVGSVGVDASNFKIEIPFYSSSDGSESPQYHPPPSTYNDMDTS